MDKVPKQFWGKWYKHYLKRDYVAMEEHMGKTLLGRMHPYAASVLNDYFVDLMEYLETTKRVIK